MDNSTKVILSNSELAMARDKNIILTKRAIIEKASDLFTRQIPNISNVFAAFLTNDEILAASIPKISKGENYKGLPYVILDYPAIFTSEHIFAVRTMFWWGNFISITLHLRGAYKEKYFDQIVKSLKDDETVYITVGNKEWEHDFEPGNFENIVALTTEKIDRIKKQKFIKVALKYELHHWNMMQSILLDGYKKIVAIVSS